MGCRGRQTPRAGSADRGERRVEVDIGRTVAPDRGDLRRHQPVVGLRQRRVPIAREALERGARRLHGRRGPRRPTPSSSPRGPRRRGDPDALATAYERVGRRASGDLDRAPFVPRTLTVARSTWSNSRKCSASARAYVVDRAPQVVLGKGECGVLHRVRRHDERVVAVGVGGVKSPSSATAATTSRTRCPAGSRTTRTTWMAAFP